MLVMVTAIACTMTACSFGDKEEDTQIVVGTDESKDAEEEKEEKEEKETVEEDSAITADAQTTRYISANRLISMELPDATWSAKIDQDDMWSFEAAGQGKILIIHGDSEDMESMVMPNTEDMANSIEAAADMVAGTDFLVNNYTAKEKKGVNIYTYAVKYYDTEKSNGYAYTVNRIFENGEEYFSIIGSVKNKSSFTAIKDAIKTFQIGEDSSLSAAAPMTIAAASKSTEREEEEKDAVKAESEEKENTVETIDKTETSDTTETVAESTSSNGGFTEEELNDTNKTRTLYRNSDGKALVVYTDANGNWVDKEGNTYRFSAETGCDAYDQNDVDYYYHGEAANVYYMPVE